MVVISCVALLAYASAASPQAPAEQLSLPKRTKEGSEFFVWLSDPHMDLHYGLPDHKHPCTKAYSNATLAANSFGVIGCDPPLALIESAAKAAGSINGTKMLVFTGDFVRHGPEHMPKPWENVSEIIGSGSRILRSNFGSLGAVAGFSLGGLGNNDSPKNYEINITENLTSNPWISRVARIFADEDLMQEPAVAKYSYGGFYEAQVAGLTMLTIDTLIYSKKHPQPLLADPFGQFAWLRQRLTAVAEENATAWIVGHIPPGIETNGFSELWHPQYVQAYLEITQDSLLGGAVAAQLFGHTHTDEFRLLPSPPKDAGPILIGTAISPIYTNPPSFKLVEYDPASGRPLSFSVYWAALIEGARELHWRFGYTATDLYPELRAGVSEVGFLSQSAFFTLSDSLRNDATSWLDYSTWYKTRYANDQNAPKCMDNETARAECAAVMVCAITVSDQDTFNSCAGLPQVELADPGKVSSTVDDLQQYQLLRDKHWQAIQKRRAEGVILAV